MTRVVLGVLVAASAAASLAARQQPVFRSGVDVVRIDAAVMNGRSAVGGLTKDHFAITDNGIPQTIDSVSTNRVPLSLMLVLDTSESLLGPPIAALIGATRRLIDSLRPDEAASLVIFPIRCALPVRIRMNVRRWWRHCQA